MMNKKQGLGIRNWELGKSRSKEKSENDSQQIKQIKLIKANFI